MKRKWLVLGAAAVLVVASGLTTASAKIGFNLNMFSKQLGNKHIQEGE